MVNELTNLIFAMTQERELILITTYMSVILKRVNK